MFNVYKNIEIKRDEDGKINPYSCCIDRGFKKFETINGKQFRGLLKV